MITFYRGKYKIFLNVSLKFSLPFISTATWRKPISNQSDIIISVFQNLDSMLFFPLMGLKFLTIFSIEKLEIKHGLLTGRIIKATFTYFYYCKYQVYSIFFQDLNLFTSSWELSSFNTGSQPQILNQKLNLKRSKKKGTNRRS